MIKKAPHLCAQGDMPKEFQGAQDTFQTSMGYGLQVGQTEVRELRFLRMPSMGVRELGRQPKHVLIKCFKRNDTCLHELTAPFGPGKQTVGPTLGPACAFSATASGFSQQGVNCG